MKRTAVEVFPPGDRLKEELEARGWSQADLAEILGRPARLVSEVITAKRAITPETAMDLGLALGTGPELWMNLESQYRLSQARASSDAITSRARILGRFPVREMQKRGWLKRVSSLAAIESELQQYFGVLDLDGPIEVAHVAKKTSYDKVSMLQVAWLVRARQLAATMQVPRYDARSLSGVCSRLRECVAQTSDAAQAAGILAAAGVGLLFVQPLPGSKIDGACMWLEGQPFIVLSLRYDRHDIFWHALFHELDHVQHGEGKQTPIIDSNMMTECSGGPEIEKRANRAAAARLIPEELMEDFVKRAGPYFSVPSILNFAAAIKVHPGIVIGQLQHRELIAWSSMNSLKAKIREVVTASTVCDGFESLVR